MARHKQVLEPYTADKMNFRCWPANLKSKSCYPSLSLVLNAGLGLYRPLLGLNEYWLPRMFHSSAQLRAMTVMAELMAQSRQNKGNSSDMVAVAAVVEDMVVEESSMTPGSSFFFSSLATF